MNQRLDRSSAVRSMGWIAATALGAILAGCGGNEAPPPSTPAPSAAPTVEAAPDKARGKRRPPVDVSSRHDRNKKRAAETKPAS